MKRHAYRLLPVRPASITLSAGLFAVAVELRVSPERLKVSKPETVFLVSWYHC